MTSEFSERTVYNPLTVLAATWQQVALRKCASKGHDPSRASVSLWNFNANLSCIST